MSGSEKQETKEVFIRMWADELGLTNFQCDVLIGTSSGKKSSDLAAELTHPQSPVYKHHVDAAVKVIKEKLGVSQKQEIFYKVYEQIHKAGL